jgi:hypothetical protein
LKTELNVENRIALRLGKFIVELLVAYAGMSRCNGAAVNLCSPVDEFTLKENNVFWSIRAAQACVP